MGFAARAWRGYWLSLILAVSAPVAVSAGETDLMIPIEMAAEALGKLARAGIKATSEETTDKKHVVITVKTKDSKRAREVIVRGEVVERIREPR